MKKKGHARLLRLLLAGCLAFPALPSLAQTTELDSLLNMSLEELMNVKVVSASRKAEDRNLAPATVYVVTEADIRTNGYYTLKDALQNVPGITIIDPGFFLFGGQRGFVSNFSQTLLMINGREIQNLIAAETFISSQFATHNIKQIEIMQGPGSSLYGANALVGVINIITKHDAKDFEKLEVQLDAGTQHTQALSMVFGKNKGRMRVSGSARVYRSDNWDFTSFVQDTVHFSQAISPLARSIVDPKQGFSNRHFTVPISGKISFRDFYVGIESYYLETSKGLENISLDYKSQRDYRLLGMSYAGWDGQVNAKTRMVVEYQFSNERFWGRNYNFNQKVFDQLVAEGRNPNAPITQAEVHQHFTDSYSQENSPGSKRHRLDARLNTIVGKEFDITIGYLFDYLDILGISKSAESVSPYFNTNRQGEDEGVYLLTIKNALFAQVKKPLLNNKLHVTLGSRYDYHNKYGGIFNLRSGLVYQAGTRTYLKALYGQAFREPNIFEYGAHSHDGLNLNLKPARINSLEASITHQLGANVQLMLTAYYNAVTQLIVPTSTVNFTNSGEVQSVYGLEGQVIFKWNKLSGDLNYTYTNPKDRQLGGQAVDALNNYKNRANLGLNYDVWKYLRLNARLNYHSAITAFHGNPVFAYHQVPNPKYNPNDPGSSATILNPLAKLNTISAFTNVNFTISSQNLVVEGANVRLQGTLNNAFNSTFYQPNVRVGGSRQFLQPGRQLIARVIFEM